uniref:Uncharacterized protein n=1 Tax=Opuntia streptacantha TaxID=393608 RepID=A0A7C8YH64_OPUST
MRPMQYSRIAKRLASPQLLSRETCSEHENCTSRRGAKKPTVHIPENLYRKPINQDCVITPEFPSKTLHLHQDFAIHADNQAWVVGANSVAFNHEIVHWAIVAKLSPCEEEFLPINMLPFCNKNSHTRARDSISFLKSFFPHVP